MKRIEPTSRYGRISVRNAEVPANPAAIMNGKSGRQQLDAARTLPTAARLAATVPAPLDNSDRVVPAGFASSGMSSPQCCLSQRPIVDGFEAILHPEVGEQLPRANHAWMRDLEAWFPWHQINFCPPDGANQDETLLRTSDALTTAEPEEPCLAHNATRLFQDFSAKSLLPRLITFGTASRPTPALGIIADQHDAVVRYAQSICAMRRSRRRL